MKTVKRNGEILVAAAAVLLAAAIFAWSQGGLFRFLGPLSRVVTPNGDGRNDHAVLCFDDPGESEVSGRVYSLLGTFVADFSPLRIVAPGASGCPTGAMNKQYYITWDGKSGGAAVRSGVYIYQVRAEGRSFRGSLLVVK
ncbi:MAG: hypothetical protein PHF00_04970 [Elusimicrobia bacterium]|nr:hypothetical protein [Elusimicrobiota bacterium]